LSSLVVAGPAHTAALAAIHAAAFADREIWHEADFARQLALPGTMALIDPRGGLVLARAVADEAEILTIGVTPDRRREGVGRGLLAAALLWAREAGAARMFLEVAADDPAARAFYAQAGFTQVGRRSHYYRGGGDALLLRLSLCEATGS
jgi:ribosomal-protein-alanine N-acetyltransferase